MCLTHEYRGLFAGGEERGQGQSGQVFGGRKQAVGTRATGMYHALGDTLAVKPLEFLDQLHILQQYRASGTGGLRMLVVTNGSAVVTGQRRGQQGWAGQQGCA